MSHSRRCDLHGCGCPFASRYTGRGARTTAFSPRGWRLIAATSLAGVRGAITLAGILTLPLGLPDGTPFPARDLAIFLAAAVIIVSLVAASIGLPHLLKGLRLPPESSGDRREDIARVAAARAAIKAIERKQHELGQGRSDANLYAEAAVRLMDVYRQRIDGRTKTGEDAQLVRHIEDIEHKLRVEGIQAERDELFRLGRSRRIPQDVVRKLVREVDYLETRYVH